MEKFGLILKHIKVLYYAFIVVIILDMGYQMYTFRFTDIVKSFNEGYNAGYDEGYNLTTNKDSDHGYKISDTLHSLKEKSDTNVLTSEDEQMHENTLTSDSRLNKKAPFRFSRKLYDLHYNHYDNNNSIQTILVNDSLKIKVQVTGFDATVYSQKALHTSNVGFVVMIFCVFGGAVAGLYIFILSIILLINIGKSIIRKDIFNLKTIKLCKQYALVLIIFSVLMGVSRFLDEYAVAQFFKVTDWDFISSFPLDLTGISTAILVYLFSEILKIGYLLKQEQELTI